MRALSHGRVTPAPVLIEWRHQLSDVIGKIRSFVRPGGKVAPEKCADARSASRVEDRREPSPVRQLASSRGGRGGLVLPCGIRGSTECANYTCRSSKVSASCEVWRTRKTTTVLASMAKTMRWDGRRPRPNKC